MTALSVDCEEYIEEHAAHFTGRDWVFQAVAAWVGDPDGPQLYLLQAPPGAGKTAIAGRLAQFSLAQAPAPTLHLSPNFLTYAHFCRARHDSTLNPLRFVSGLSQALATRSDDFRRELQRLLETKSDRNYQFSVHQEVDQVHGGTVTGVQLNINISGESARRAFDLLVKQPLENIDRWGADTSFFILVDSLDEALTFDPSDHVVALLKTVGDFPPTVRFLVTSREDQRVRSAVGEPALDLVAGAPASSDDIYDYAVQMLGGQEAFARRLSDKAQGNFLYARYVLEALPAAATEEDLETLQLPEDLEDVYSRFLDRKLGGATDEWLQKYSPVLGVVSLARGSGLTETQLAEITELPRSSVKLAIAGTRQYLLAANGQGPYRIYHQSFRDFLDEHPVYPIYPAESEALLGAWVWKRWQGRNGAAPDLYGLKYGAAHLVAAAERDLANRARWATHLVDLAADPAFWEKHAALVADPTALQDVATAALHTAAGLDSAQGALLTIRAAHALLALQRQQQRPEALFTLAREGRLDEAQARLQLLGVERKWQQAVALLLAWLAPREAEASAREIANRVAAEAPGQRLFYLLGPRVEASLSLGAPPLLPELPAEPPPALVDEILRRLGGETNVSMLPMLPAMGDELNVSLDVQRNEMLLWEDHIGEHLDEEGMVYVGQMDGPLLVSFALANPQEGTEVLRKYVAIHAANNYVYYRNQSLWGVLEAALSHPDDAWARQMAVEIAQSALAGNRLEFDQALPLALRALLGQLSAEEELQRLQTASTMDAPDNAQAQTLDAWGSAIVKLFEGGHPALDPNAEGDAWGSITRRLAAAAEALAIVRKEQWSAQQLLDTAWRLPRGYAGFRAPALLTLAESCGICGVGDARIADILHEAMAAAQNIQDPVFCVRTVARVQALRLRYWSESDLDVTQAVEELLADPAGPPGASLHRVGQDFALREVSEGLKLRLPEIAYQADTLNMLASLYQQPPVALARLNPDWDVEQKLPPDTLIAIPDPGFTPLSAACLAAFALSNGAPARLVQRLAPLASANPTALDTLLARLLLARQEQAPEIVDELQQVVGN